MSISYDATSAPNPIEVIFELPEVQSFDGARTESLWAQPLDGGRFQLLNTPFHVTGVSLNDIITATPLPGHDGRFLYGRVVQKSGRSTYRVLTYPDTTLADFLTTWKQLEAIGCTYEQPPGGLTALHAIDVPPAADIEQVLVLLRSAQVAGVWDFEQGDCGHAA
jgi:hypothetical protein